MKMLDELLNSKNPEIYDLKDEMKYKGVNSVEKWEKYYYSKDGFDCDGTIGKNYCNLIREIYRVLWDWEDICQNNRSSKKVYRYGKISLASMNDARDTEWGPETMNSFYTTHKNWKHDIETNLWDIFAGSVGRIGNMTLTCRGYNKYFAYDYWDIKISRLYLDNKELNVLYVNCFFQWDYVKPAPCGKKYCLKTFWSGHEKHYLPGEKNDVINYIKCVDIYTKRRGLFLVGMLQIASSDIEEYKKIREGIFLSKEIYGSFINVIEDILKKFKTLKEETKKIIIDTQKKIEYLSI